MRLYRVGPLLLQKLAAVAAMRTVGDPVFGAGGFPARIDHRAVTFGGYDLALFQYLTADRAA